MMALIKPGFNSSLDWPTLKVIIASLKNTSEKPPLWFKKLKKDSSIRPESFGYHLRTKSSSCVYLVQLTPDLQGTEEDVRREHQSGRTSIGNQSTRMSSPL